MSPVRFLLLREGNLVRYVVCLLRVEGAKVATIYLRESMQQIVQKIVLNYSINTSTMGLTLSAHPR